jgi:hypothetical protein
VALSGTSNCVCADQLIGLRGPDSSAAAVDPRRPVVRVVFNAAHDGGAAVGGQRDGNALSGVPNRADANQLGPPASPAARVDPRRQNSCWRGSRSPNDATGKLMLQIIGSIAEFERSIMLSRQLEGIAKAKAEGKYRGGMPTARAKAEQVFALVDAGKTRGEAAEALGISIRSVFRILRTRNDAEKAPVASPVARFRTRPQVSA